MEIAIMWGWILTASWGSMPPIIDPNYKTEQQCEAVKAEFVALHQDYNAACTPTWKPDTAPKVHKKRAVHTTKKPTTYRRTVARR